MFIATLDRLVTLQAPVVVRDSDYGSEQITWIDYDQVWAGITEQAQAEATDQERRLLTASAVIRLRWRTDVLPTHRLVDDQGRTWEITGITAAGRRREALDLACQAYGQLAPTGLTTWDDSRTWDDTTLWQG